MSSALKAHTHSLTIVTSSAADALPETAWQKTAMSAVCSHCDGTGLKIIQVKGGRRCKCRNQNNRVKVLEAARIPCRYRECARSNYLPKTGASSPLQVFNYAVKPPNKYPAVERGLLLKVSVGVGKLHLETTILRKLSRRSPLACSTNWVPCSMKIKIHTTHSRKRLKPKCLPRTRSGSVGARQARRVEN